LQVLVAARFALGVERMPAELRFTCVVFIFQYL
jgi:hypothetical protein